MVPSASKYSILDPCSSFCFLFKPYAMLLSATCHVYVKEWSNDHLVVFLVGGSEQVISKLQQWQQNAGRCKISSNTEPLSNLKKIASEKGYRISDNSGSGNCMFHALSEQLEIVKGVKIHHFELRHSLVQYLREHPKQASICQSACNVQDRYYKCIFCFTFNLNVRNYY